MNPIKFQILREKKEVGLEGKEWRPMGRLRWVSEDEGWVDGGGSTEDKDQGWVGGGQGQGMGR